MEVGMSDKERLVPQITTSLRSYRPELESMRIKQKESLDHDFVMENFEPQLVKRIPFVGRGGIEFETGIYNVISPYTGEDWLHVLVMNSTRHYCGTPSEMRDAEGKRFMEWSARIVDYMLHASPEAPVVSWGCNVAPLNIGVPEQELGGVQTLLPKFHAQVWMRPREEDIPKVSLEKLPQNVKDFLQGDPLNYLATLLVQQMVSARRYEPWINGRTFEQDNNRVRVKLNMDLSTALHRPDFFVGFLKPLHGYLEEMAMDVWNALSADDYLTMKQAIQDAFEGRRDPMEVYNLLQQPPVVKPRDSQLVQIGRLQKKYPDWFIKRLMRFGAHLTDRDETDWESKQKNRKLWHSWIRKGLGYSLALTQDARLNRAELFIRPVVKLSSSRGGVVESQGMSLIRDADEACQKEDEERNIRKVNELKAYLDFEEHTGEAEETHLMIRRELYGF